MADAPVSKATPERQKAAEDIGWIPPERFKGDPEKFIDAEAFIERGEQVLPILRKTNEGLHRDNAELRTALEGIKGALVESQDSIKALQEFHNEDTKRQVATARRTLLDQLKQAKKDENVDAEVEINDELTRLTLAEKRADEDAAAKKAAETAASTAAAKGPAPHEDPEFKAWLAENTWFGKDARKTGLANGIAAELRANKTTLTRRAFLDKVVEELDKTLDPGRRAAAARVESSGGSAFRASTTRTYADLPADAKVACDGFASRLVGPNRAFKTLDDWRKDYAAKYFEGEST